MFPTKAVLLKAAIRQVTGPGEEPIIIEGGSLVIIVNEVPMSGLLVGNRIFTYDLSAHSIYPRPCQSYQMWRARIAVLDRDLTPARTQGRGSKGQGHGAR